MSSAAQNDENQGVPHSGNQPNNSSENGGQDPRSENENDDEGDIDFVPPPHPEACQACDIYESEAKSLVSQLTVKQEEISNLTHSLKAKHAELESIKQDYEHFLHGKHELNVLRTLVLTMSNLGVPVNDHFGPDQVFMDHVKPSATKAFNSPLANIPSGAWGSMRTIQVESTGSTDLVPQLISSSMENYYVTNAFAEYRQLLAEFLNSRKLFQCAACLRPLYSKHQWILCMRCLAVPYCSTTCIHTHKALHVIGCKTHHVWRTDIEPPKPTSTVDSTSISTSSSYSSSDGNGGKGTGKSAGAPGQRSSKRQRTLCRH
jgi:hypothetical protein